MKILFLCSWSLLLFYYNMVKKSQTKWHKGTQKLLAHFRKKCGRLKPLIASENNVSLCIFSQKYLNISNKYSNQNSFSFILKFQGYWCSFIFLLLDLEIYILFHYISFSLWYYWWYLCPTSNIFIKKFL